jgi:hypothetical protein
MRIYTKMKYISYTLLGIFISALLSCANGPTPAVNNEVELKPFILKAKFLDKNGSPIKDLTLKLDKNRPTYNKIIRKSGITDQNGIVALKGMKYRNNEYRFWEFDIEIADTTSTKNYEIGYITSLRDIISKKIGNKENSINITFSESFVDSVLIINLEFKLGFKQIYFNGAFDIFPKKLIDEIDNLPDFDDNKSIRFILNNVDIETKFPEFSTKREIQWKAVRKELGTIESHPDYTFSNNIKVKLPESEIQKSNKIDVTFKFKLNEDNYEKEFNFNLKEENIQDKQTLNFSLPLRLHFKGINNHSVKGLTIEYETADGVKRVKTDNSGVIEVNVHDIKYPFKIRNLSKAFIVVEKILVNKKSDLKEIKDFKKTVRVHEGFKTVNAIVKLTSYENMVPESCNIKAYINYNGNNGDTKDFVDIKNNDKITFKITRDKLETKDIAVRFYVNNQKYFSLAKVLNFNFDDQNNYLLEFKLDHPKFYISQNSRAHLWEKLPNRNNINNIIYELILNDKLISDKYQFVHGCIKYQNNNLLIDMTSRNSYNTKIYTERKLAGFLFDDYIRKVVRKTNDNLQGISNLAAIHTNIAHSKRDFSNSSDTDQVNDCVFQFNLTDTKKYVDYDITGREFLKISRIIYNGERIEPDLN